MQLKKSGFLFGLLEFFLLFASPFAYLFAAGLHSSLDIGSVIIAKIGCTLIVLALALVGIIPVKKFSSRAEGEGRSKAFWRKKNKLTTRYLCAALPALGAIDYTLFSYFMNHALTLHHALIYLLVGLLAGSLSIYKMLNVMKIGDQ